MLDAQTDVLPEIGPGIGRTGFTVTANVLTLLVPHGFTVATDTLPLCAEACRFTEIEVPVADPLMAHPAGTIHLYDVAPGTAAML